MLRIPSSPRLLPAAGVVWLTFFVLGNLGLSGSAGLLSSDRARLDGGQVQRPAERRDLRASKVAIDALDRRPLSFEPNQGQVPGDRGFISRGKGFSLLLGPADLLLSLRTNGDGSRTDGSREIRIRMMGIVGALARKGSNRFLERQTTWWATTLPDGAPESPTSAESCTEISTPGSIW